MYAGIHQECDRGRCGQIAESAAPQCFESGEGKFKVRKSRTGKGFREVKTNKSRPLLARIH